jgi:hypothetical protein
MLGRFGGVNRPRTLFSRLLYNSRWGDSPNQVRAKIVLLVEDVENGKAIRWPRWSISLTLGDYETLLALKTIIKNAIVKWLEESDDAES